jgi:GPH family glycoside/pentoside/hexuronide:cation symporter
MGNAASSFCMKVGSGVGTAALGWILDAGGFDGKLAVAEQPASALTAITVSFSWVPLIFVAIAVLCLVFMDLDKHYDKAVADLQQGKHRND